MFTLSLPWPDTYLLLSPPWQHLSAWLRWPLLVCLVVGPFVLLLQLYRYELRLVHRLTALTLLFLRLTVLTLIVGLVVMQPVYARDVRSTLPGRVIVVVDRSASMDLPDPQRNPADKLRLLRGLKWLPDDLPASLVDQWINETTQRREPTMLLPAEEKDEATRGEKSASRWKQFGTATEKADTLTRTETARRILSGDGLDLLGKVGKRHAVEFWTVDREVREWVGAENGRDGAALFAVAHASGSESDRAFTNLSAALNRVQRHGRGEVIGVVLLTDGQHNHGPAPGAAARLLGERGVPIFPVVLGDRQSPPDAAIVELRSPSHHFYKGVEGSMEVCVRIAGLPAGEYGVELRAERAVPHTSGSESDRPERAVHHASGSGIAIDKKIIQHDGKDQVYELVFPVKMDVVGQKTLTAVVTVPAGVKDSVPNNNRLSTSVSVADDRVKVLLADGCARWEYHYLATMLQRDRLIELTRVVFDQPRLTDSLPSKQEENLGLPRREWPAEPETLSAYACVILGDVDAKRLTLPERQRLEQFVSEAGGTLIIIAGKEAMPMGFPQTTPAGDTDPLVKLLPIESPRELRPAEGFALSLTRAGREARFMELESDREENESLWAGHPKPWAWAVAGTAKPGATVLAGWLDPRQDKLNPTQRERQNAVLVRHSYGFGRVLYVGLDSTWRWRFRVGDLYHHRFWGQVIRWAAADKPLAVGNEWLRFGTPQPVYRVGETVDLTACIAEKTGPLKPDLLAAARVIALDSAGGKSAANPANGSETPRALVPLARPEGRPRVLEGKLRDLPPGHYAVELAIPDLASRLTENGQPLRTTFTIVPPRSEEMLRLEANLPLLEDLAVASAGRVFRPEEVPQLHELLTARQRPEVERVPTKLYQWWGMLATVVGLLSVEWLIRKAAGLP